jgi:hypothetical protein
VTHPLRTIRTIVNEEVLAAFKTVLLPPAQTTGGPRRAVSIQPAVATPDCGDHVAGDDRCNARDAHQAFASASRLTSSSISLAKTSMRNPTGASNSQRPRCGNDPEPR